MSGREHGRALAICAGLVLSICIPAAAQHSSHVELILGTGVAGTAADQTNNPYGLVIGPDGALYYCEVDNQRVRRLDLKTHQATTVAGNGQKGYTGDGGPAVNATLNAPHEVRFDASGNMYVAERDNAVIRKVDGKTGIISTVAGTGVPGFSGDGGPGAKAQLTQPHCIEFRDANHLLICDLGNQRLRELDLRTGIISTYAGTGKAGAAPDGAPLQGSPLNGPRTLAVAPNGDIYLALREGNAIYRVDQKTQTLHHLAGTGETGYSGDGGPALAAKLGGPKGLTYASGRLIVADTENHVIRQIDLQTGVITTILGTGKRGDGPETTALDCGLARPHGVFATSDGALYVSNSEAHRILEMP
jgi:DNA-binding beta-propeller fold protein YncE